MIALGIFFLLRRRSHEPAQEPHPSDRFYKSELDSRNAPGSRGTNNTLPHEAAAVVPVEKAAVVPVEKDAGNVPVELESPGWDGTTAYSPGIRSPGIDSVVSPMTYNGGGDWRQEKPRGAWA